jgi:hypothetical protein
MAQSSVGGRITDAAGMPLRKATVHFEHLDKHKKYQISTDKEGKYRYFGLPEGKYRISAFAPDGKLLERKEVSLLPGDETKMDFAVKEAPPDGR